MSARRKSKTNNRKKAVEQAPIDSIEVKLQPVFGIQPRTYVPFLWGLILLTVVFVLLILPGLRNNGTLLTIESLPSDASVIVDGVRLGATGEAIFVPRGRRELAVQRVGFEPDLQTIDISGRVIASAIFPRRASLRVRLQPSPGFNHLAYGAGEFAAWAATGPQRGRYALPPVLTLTARDALQSRNTYQDLPSAVLPLAIDERHLADILRAQFILESAGAPPGIGSITGFLEHVVSNPYPGPDRYNAVLEIMDGERLQSADLGRILDIRTEETNNLIAQSDDTYAEIISVSRFPTNLVGNNIFVSLPGLSAPIGDIEVVAGGYNPRSGALPILAEVKGFSISATEVTNDEFAVFISQKPEWSVENLSALTGAKLVDEHYLSSWNISGPPPGSGNDPVTEVSWHAASAYAEWFSDRYMGNTGRRARLPDEDEWEIAARLNGVIENTMDLPAGLKSSDSADTGDLGLRGMAGNVREWCRNPYRINENRFRPKSGISSYQDTGSSLVVPDRPVRGGAHIDGNLAFPAAARGGLPSYRTSPVLGFRLVISP